MIIEEAVFGEVLGGHGLRGASPGILNPAELASRLDLPDTAPPGVSWTPFVSGFPYRDRFVLARTFPDDRAARAGLVVSHALLAPLAEVIRIADLRPLFARLAATAAGVPAKPHRLEIEPAEQEQPQLAELSAIAEALVSRGSGPVVRLGAEGFESVAAALWARLPPAIRRGLAFRLSFGPADVVEKPPPILVCTPPALVTRWSNHRVAADRPTASNSLVAAILGGRDDGAAMYGFAAGIGAEPATIAELLLLEHAYRLSVLEPGTVRPTTMAIRLVERLSGDVTRGANGKRDLLDRLRHDIGLVTAEDLLPLRNLSLTGFEQSGRIWEAVASRVAGGFPASEDVWVRTLVADAVDPAAGSSEWRGAVLRGLSATDANALAQALWRWADADPARIPLLWKAAGADGRLADPLVDAAPDRLSADVAEVLLELAQDRQLTRLHGVVAGVAFPPVEAVRRQLVVEPAPEVAGLRLALRLAAPGEVVRCAVEIGEARLVVLAAEQVAREPALLAAVDLAGDVAREIWSAALVQNPSAWNGPADPRACFDAILFDLMDGSSVTPGLVERLATTPLADLSRFGRRAGIWAVPSPAVPTLLAATARGWLDRIATTEPDALESELRDAVQRDTGLDRALARVARRRVDVALKIVGMLPKYSEDAFRLWSDIATRAPMSAQDAEALGRLIFARRWDRALGDLLPQLRGREDLQPAVRICLPRIGRFTQFRYGITRFSSSDKWELLALVAEEFYPHGPDHNNLWGRARGKGAMLDTSGDGRSQWHAALRLIRQGGDAPTLKQLLQTMQKDFSKSVRLKALTKDYRRNPGSWE